jgi:PhnB protein
MKTATQRIPPGCHTITPPLTVRAAAAAIDFCRRAFGAAELMRMPGPGTSARGE